MTPTTERLDVMLLVSSLERGGAERQVVHLANGLIHQHCRAHICALSPKVPLAEDLVDPGCLHVMPKSWRFDLGVVGRVAAKMRDLEIDIAHAFLFDAEMVARLAARRAGVPVVIASERNSDYVRPWLHAACLRMTRSRFDVMIANSNAGKRFNIKTQGLDDSRIHVIHNGVDIERFQPGHVSACRQAMGLDGPGPVIGMAASFKQQKNHMMFLRVAAALHARFPNARFVCAGQPLMVQNDTAGALGSGARGHSASVAYHTRIAEELKGLGLEGVVLMLGRQDDMVPFYNACDVVVLTSRHEGTPNVLLEAMACGRPVVATAVADNAVIVPDGRAGYIIDLDDDTAMIDKVATLLDNDALRQDMGAAAREWVVDRFSLTSMVKQTADVYRAVHRRKTSPESV